MKYTIDVCYHDGKRRGVVVVGREENLSVAKTYTHNLLPFVNENVEKVRVYNPRIMKEVYVLIRDHDISGPTGLWVEAIPNTDNKIRFN